MIALWTWQRTSDLGQIPGLNEGQQSLVSNSVTFALLSHSMGGLEIENGFLERTR